MAWGRRRSSPKILKNQPTPPVFLPANVSLFSLSPRCFFSPWRPHKNLSPPPTYGGSASPRTQILISGRTAIMNLSLSSANLFLLSPTATPAAKTLHQCRHQPTRPPSTSLQASDNNSIPFARSPFIFLSIVCNCVVACRTWTIVHVLQNN